MNLNFTITTRDKILLAVLAVILFVGMMYLYGVMPANEEAADLEKEITAKQQELAELQAQIAAINIGAVDDEYDKLLDYYYTADRGELAENLNIIAINRMVIAMLDEAKITGYSTVGWNITPQRLTGNYGDYKGEYLIATANITTPYKALPEDLYAFIADINADPFFTMTDISIEYVEEAADDGTETTPDTGGRNDDTRHGRDHGAHGTSRHHGAGHLQPRLLYARGDGRRRSARAAGHCDGAFRRGRDAHLQLGGERGEL